MTQLINQFCLVLFKIRVINFIQSYGLMLSAQDLFEIQSFKIKTMAFENYTDKQFFMGNYFI